MERTPDHHDAELVLRLYELRGEAVMRENRAKLIRDLWPRKAEEMVEVTKLDHPLNVAYRQVTTYWEMAYTFCRHGTLHPDVLLDTSFEGLFIFARIEPFLAELRAATNPRVLRSTEWIVTETEIGRSVMEFQRARVKKMLEARAT